MGTGSDLGGKASDPEGPVLVRVADPPDIEAIADLLTEAARHQRRFEAGGGWPIPFPRESVAEGVQRREFHVAERGPAIVGTFSLSWDDPRFWGPQPPVAGYLHKLAVRRADAHRGVGRQLIEWTAQRTRAEERSFLRLDCLRGNAPLIAFYESAGFRKVRVVRFEPPGPPFDFQLMERRIDRERVGALSTKR